jgi:hypothetical protein
VIAYDIHRQWTINTGGQILTFLLSLRLIGGASFITERFVNPQDQVDF